MSNILIGILIPFFGTTLGAACVFLLRGEKMPPHIQKGLLGFASGVMVAASVWSLLIPAMDMSADMGKLAFAPAAAGVAVGMLFLLLLDKGVPHQHMDHKEPEGPRSSWQRSTMLVMAVTLHNIPEGMAVGVVFAGLLADNAQISLMGAFALSIGIAIQNFPEGAIISLPLKSEGGVSRGRAFLSPSFCRGFSPRCCPSFCPLRRGPCCMWWWKSSFRRPTKESTAISEHWGLRRDLSL